VLTTKANETQNARRFQPSRSVGHVKITEKRETVANTEQSRHHSPFGIHTSFIERDPLHLKNPNLPIKIIHVVGIVMCFRSARDSAWTRLGTFLLVVCLSSKFNKALSAPESFWKYIRLATVLLSSDTGRGLQTHSSS